MYNDLKGIFWWPNMKRAIAQYVLECTTCQQKTTGPLQPLEILTCKWEGISMDFVTGLPRTSVGYDAIWVIVDRLTKVAQFIPIKKTYSLQRLPNYISKR
jgi:hypothetical protein